MNCGATIGAIPRNIPYSRVSCDGNELAYVREVLDSGWLTTASKAQEFERRFAAGSGAPVRHRRQLVYVGAAPGTGGDGDAGRVIRSSCRR